MLTQSAFVGVREHQRPPALTELVLLKQDLFQRFVIIISQVGLEGKGMGRERK